MLRRYVAIRGVLTTTCTSFGEAGEAVITSAVDLMFPLGGLADKYLEPFTPKGFVQLVLVPELAMMLISEEAR